MKEIDLKDAVALHTKVLAREGEIRDLLGAVAMPMDEVTLLALLAIVHMTFARASLQSKEMEPAFELAQEIIEAKKKGVM